MTTEHKQLVYIGTYTHLKDGEADRPESIYIYEFNSSSGKLDLKNTVNDVVNPSFLTLSKDGKRLFAVNEDSTFSGVSGGGISAFTLNSEGTQASFINAQPTHGAHPCYISLDATEKWALVANYSGGNVTVLPIADDGSLGAHTALIQNHGSSVNKERQEKAHAHSVIFDPQQHYAFVADLGIDQILIFRFDAASGQLISHGSVATEPGAGPRHLEFHPNNRYLYVTNELTSTIGVYDYDADNGTLAHKQTISALPDDFTGIRWAADIHITRSGQFLYASNRGHDSIAVFAVDPNQGTLTLVETVPTGGQTPRNFALDLSENFLLVANQESHNVIVFQVDKSNGRLTQTASAITIPSPVCVKMVKGKLI
jgi:6-phosphogluconolactonase